jgi:oxygen-independent coproporphyrinogen-3 oxidase
VPANSLQNQSAETLSSLQPGRIDSPVLGIYCHIPFCASTCDFCAFYQEKPRRVDLDRYLRAMEDEFSRLPTGRPVETVFWGGGTPGLLPARDLERLGSALLKAIGSPPHEWTVEMAPSTVKADKLAVLRDLGVTRISMGVQSFDPDLLASLGRLHNRQQIFSAWERVMEADFPQTNLDLIFAIPNQSEEQLLADLRQAAALGPGHISTYCLTFEEDTALFVKLAQGKIQLDEAREIDFYRHTWDELARLGYAQYEISNFARPGQQCLHNLNTWRMQEWIGCGPSAASQYGGLRYQRPSNLDQWIAGFEDPESRETGAREQVVELDQNMLLGDSIIFGLRMNEGIDLVALKSRFPDAQNGAAIECVLREMADSGLIRIDKGRYHPSREGQLLADGIGAKILEIA